MPKKIELSITEDLEQLDRLYRSSVSPLRKDRLKTLYYIKRGDYQYRNLIAAKLGRRPTTVGLWIGQYRDHGLSGLLKIESGGNNTRHLSDKVIQFISDKLMDPATTITSYVELQSLIEEELCEQVNYGALYAHCRRNHRAKLKVSRKSHHKKDGQAEEVFKKP